MPTSNAHRKQLASFMRDYLENGRKYFQEGGSAQFVKEAGLDIIRDCYPLVRVVDLVAIDEFVEKTDLN